ncbi:unnamed protein product, partial [Rotaria socialis]
NIPANSTWAQNGVTIAGGNWGGDATNQLYSPYGPFVDDDQTVNGDTMNGQVVAGGNGEGNGLHQLNIPTDVLIDKETDSLIICDQGNQRVVRWSRRSGTTQGEILIDNIWCWGLAMDEQRYLYVSDYGKHAVRRYQLDEKKGTLVAGGNDKGSGLSQLNVPTYLFVDRDHSVYVSDNWNDRVMKWVEGAKERIFVDTLGTLYVADTQNDRVMRWAQGDKKQDTRIVGGNGRGEGANQFNDPIGLSFDRQVSTTAYNLRNFDAGPELTGDLLTETSERIVKKLTLEASSNPTEDTVQQIETMPNNVQDSAMMICYRECLSNLGKFNGGVEQKVLQFINNIERIGKMITANDDVLHCMCTAKLDGEAKRWYEDNMSLAQWENLKPALLERFSTSDSSLKIFEQLKERKQKLDETISSYHDAVIKLCREYDSSMSQKMMISWLQNGIKDSLKTQIKRQMKLLPESARTTQAFLKIAKDEQELQDDSPEQETTQPYMSYITNTVSTTLQDKRNTSEKVSTSTYSPPRHTTYEYKKQYTSSPRISTPLTSISYDRNLTSRPRPILRRQEPHNLPTNYSQRNQESNVKSYSSTQHDSQRRPCSICQRISHRTMDCYYKKPYGCYKCGQSDHNIRDCPQDFIYKAKSHKSANCSSINIIGEIQLEIKVHGFKTLIVADVSTNLITDLLLGNDWITQNNVIIDSPQQHIFLIDKNRRILTTTPFIKPSHLQLPVLLTDEITIPPYSEKCININILSPMINIPEALFEPATYLYPKQILLTNALIKLEDNRSYVMIINANDRQKTLSKNTHLGYISYQSEQNNYPILPVISQKRKGPPLHSKSTIYKRSKTVGRRSWTPSTYEKRKVLSTDLTCRMINNSNEQQHQCYVCQERFLSRNDLQHHLRQKFYPSDMREQVEQLTQHIRDDKRRQKLKQILWKHGKLFDVRRPSIIKATVHHAIETGTHPPTYTSPYRVSYKDEQIQRDEIDKLLKQGIIEESISPCSSPIVLVRKKDGSVRFCIDFRKLNNVTTRDAFPMPRIDDIFDHLSQAEYYTTIDFKSGYFQVGLDPKDRSKTAFSTRDQHYQFTVLPQGVTNSPPAFQRIVSQILGPTRWQYSLAYLDDIIIYSPTFDQHLQRLDDILNRLNDANFRLNINKCQIAQTAIDYLGHHIEHSNIRPSADNIRALVETQQPTTAKEAFRFVKAAEYYRKFIPGFSTIAQPLHQYAPTTKEQRSKKSQATPITLSNDALDAFNKLKKILTNDLILRIPDQNLSFKIQTDAPKIGIGAILMQTHPHGDLPVAYLSKKFTQTQMNWPATEQECYAIIYAIEKWHKYLDGRSFIIETDHKPLLPFNLKQQLNSKCERWRLKLQQYQFTVRYIKGKHNTVADYLSRSPVDNGMNDGDDYTPTKSIATQTDNYMRTQIIAPVITRRQAKQQLDERTACRLTDQACYEQGHKRNVDGLVDKSCVSTQPNDSHAMLPFTIEQLKELQHQDEEINNIIGNIQNYKEYFIEDYMLMKEACPPVPVIPKGRIRSNIIKMYHDTPANGAHFGRNKTIQKIQQRYF